MRELGSLWISCEHPGRSEFRIDVAIIGVGGIGSRHLEALLSVTQVMRLYLVDPDPLSRNRALGAVAEGLHTAGHTVEDGDDLTRLPRDLDVAIVATGSAVRRQVIGELLDRSTVRHVILEKFLFPCMSDYHAVARLLTEAGTTAWVNTTRRLWPGYQKLQAEWAGRQPISLRVQFSPSHGLGSNGVHFVDLLMFLTGRSAPRLSGSGLRVIDNERRPGYIEFEGTVEGVSAEGDHFQLTALSGSTAPVLVLITGHDEHAVIDESAGVVLRSVGEDPRTWEPRDFALRFQSQLTGTVVEELMRTGRCGLPSFGESAEAHLSLLEPFLEALGESGDNAKCLVT